VGTQEARARLELREVITTGMALDVVNLMRESMLDTLTDEFGDIDFGRNHGTSKKGVCFPLRCRTPCIFGVSEAVLMTSLLLRAAECDRFRKALHRQAEAQGQNIFHLDELKAMASSLGIKSVDRVIESLNSNQVLLMKGNRNYQLLSVE
jgi:hypothetical protein